MNNEIKNFNDLEVWKLAHQLTIEIYKITMSFPKEELYGMTSQIRRSISSVGANIAEGFERYHYKDKIRFYYQARGSLAETENFLFLAKDLKFLNVESFEKLYLKAQEVGRLINGLVRSIEKQL